MLHRPCEQLASVSKWAEIPWYTVKHLITEYKVWTNHVAVTCMYVHHSDIMYVHNVRGQAPYLIEANNCM